MKKVFLFTCLVLVLIFATKTNASSVQNSSFSIIVSPDNPEPGQNVNFTLESLSLDISRLKVTWLLNNEIQKTGLGLKKFYLVAGEAGKSQKITALIEDNNGNNLQATTEIIPAGISLLYEAFTYTPPFYKGKALNTNQADITVSAFPEIFDSVGRKFNTNELMFTWKLDDFVIGSSSGIGKNYLTIPGSTPPKDLKITVTATSLSQNISASNTLDIPRSKPVILFYEVNPVYGIMFNKSIGEEIKLLNDEFSFYAAPFYFSVGYPNSSVLKYTWSLKNNEVPNQTVKNIFTVRQEKSGSGSANAKVSIINEQRFLQQAKNESVINYQKD